MVWRYPNGSLVQSMRLKRGFSRATFAREAGLSPLTIRRAELGLPIHPRSLAAIARALNTTSRELSDPAPSPAQLAFRFDAAITFAGQDRAHAEEIAVELKSAGYRIFYDRFSQAVLWGRELSRKLADIFEHESRFCIVLVSEHYPRRGWTQLELTYALQRAFRTGDDYLLPVRLDGAEIRGLPSTLGYIDRREFTAQQIAKFFAEKAGLPPIAA
jgi:transcriptional regulator with XRE-family HTH domain